MAFSMREFIKRGLLNSIGKQPEYQIIKQAAGWLDKGVLELSDLEEIQNAMNAQSIVGDVTREIVPFQVSPEPVPQEANDEAESEASEPVTETAPEESDSVALESETPASIPEEVPKETDEAAPEVGGAI